MRLKIIPQKNLDLLNHIATTNDEGVFTFRGLHWGAYKLLAVSEKTDMSAIADVYVKPEATTDIGQISLKLHDVIRVIVEDKNGKPVIGAKIRVNGYQDDIHEWVWDALEELSPEKNNYRSFYTDASGKFEIANIPSEDVALFIHGPREQYQRAIFKKGQKEPLKVVFENADPFEVTVKVVDGKTSKPVEGATVICAEASSVNDAVGLYDMEKQKVRITGSNGVAVLNPQEKTKYFIIAYKQDRLSDEKTFVLGSKSKHNIELTLSQAPSATIKLISKKTKSL